MGIYQRKDNKKWVVRIRKNGIDYTKTFKSKTLANQDEIRVLAEIEKGTFMKEDKTMSFKEASEIYMKNYVEVHCKASTKTGYDGYLNNHILPYFENKLLCNIDKLDVDIFKTHLINKNCKHIIMTKDGLKEETTSRKLSNQTINHILKDLH